MGAENVVIISVRAGPETSQIIAFHIVNEMPHAITVSRHGRGVAWCQLVEGGTRQIRPL
jgi:hypothetical protein